jgi:transcriptional regulator with XRE-family HTH domain
VPNKNSLETLGGVVKAARQAKGFTQCQLAERLGITLRHLKAIENSGQKPSYDLLARTVRELDISRGIPFSIPYRKSDRNVEHTECAV